MTEIRLTRISGRASFIPVFNELTHEALEKTDTVDFEGIPFRAVGAAHLAVIALNKGIAKADLTI
jgi:hypothetical protein